MGGWGKALLLAVLLLWAVASEARRGGQDYYGILGVARDADDQTIKKAYRKQAL